jgi:hypothetical protein
MGSKGDGEASARAEGGGRDEGRIDDDAKARIDRDATGDVRF